MANTKFCQKCGTKLAPDSLQGLCPECLIAVALKAETPSGSPVASFTPPTVEELAPHFPTLEVLEFVAKGGMGAVYKARQKELDRLVALKILPPEAGEDPASAERFAREARSLARLNHPHIVNVHDAGQAGGYAYLLMEWVDGTDLRKKLRSGRLPPADVLAISLQICEALQFAHDQGVIHRDIKPENILLDSQGRVKVADFGISKLLHSSRAHISLTSSGKSPGTPWYMAPEQLHNPDTVDHRVDIYSLGVVLYEMLTGEVPMGHFDPPSKIPAVDVRLDPVVFRALAQKAERRYQKVSEFNTALRAILLDVRGAQAKAQDESISSHSTDAGKENPPMTTMIAIPALLATTVSQQSWRRVGVAALAAGFLLLATIMLWPRHGEPNRPEPNKQGTASTGPTNSDNRPALTTNPITNTLPSWWLDSDGQVVDLERLYLDQVAKLRHDLGSSTGSVQAANHSGTQKALPDSFALQKRHAESLLQSQRVGEATMAFETLLQDQEKSLSTNSVAFCGTLNGLGTCLLYSGRYEEAKQHFLRASIIWLNAADAVGAEKGSKRDLVESYLGMGCALINLNNISGTQKMFEWAMDNLENGSQNELLANAVLYRTAAALAPYVNGVQRLSRPLTSFAALDPAVQQNYPNLIAARLFVEVIVNGHADRTSAVAELFGNSLGPMVQSNRAGALQLVEFGAFNVFVSPFELASACNSQFAIIRNKLSQLQPSDLQEREALRSSHESLGQAAAHLSTALQMVWRRSFAKAADSFSKAETELHVFLSNIRPAFEANELIAWMNAGKCACQLREGNFGFAKAAVEEGIEQSRDARFRARLFSLKRFTVSLRDSSALHAPVGENDGAALWGLKQPLAEFASQLCFRETLRAIR